MYKFGNRSLEKRATCHPDLQMILDEMIKMMDISVLCGHRGEADQRQAVEDGMSQVHYPNSMHNSDPSLAVDVAPYPIDWDNLKRFYYMGGMFLGIAHMLKEKGLISHNVRWGGDWDRDNDLDDNRFIDLPHFELIVP